MQGRPNSATQYFSQVQTTEFQSCGIVYIGLSISKCEWTNLKAIHQQYKFAYMNVPSHHICQIDHLEAHEFFVVLLLIIPSTTIFSLFFMDFSGGKTGTPQCFGTKAKRSHKRQFYLIAWLGTVAARRKSCEYFMIELAWIITFAFSPNQISWIYVDSNFMNCCDVRQVERKY